MKQETQVQRNPIRAVNGVDGQGMCERSGGLPVRTDLRAGLAWDDLDDQTKGLWNSLTDAVGGLTGGTETSSQG